MKAKIPLYVLAVVLAIVHFGEAQQPKKVPRIGYLSNTDAATDSARAEGIRLALRELGYIEGQNVAIEHRYAEGKVDRAPELAAELVRLKIDVLFTGNEKTAVAAKNASTTIPVIGPSRLDPRIVVGEQNRQDVRSKVTGA